MTEYTLARGDAGAERLAILSEGQWPSSLRLLRQAGLRKGSRFLDVGCGAGDLSRRVAALGGRCTGVDIDPGFVARASAACSDVGFHCLSAHELDSLPSGFDVVYARYLLSHLADPQDALNKMATAARPGGTVVLEDIDFDLHTAQPRPAAFDRYLELYAKVVRGKGGDPYLGRRLYAMAVAAGLQDVKATVQVTVFAEGNPKRISSLTFLGIREALLRDGHLDADEFEAILAGLTELEALPNSTISLAGTFQVWGRRPRLG